MSYTFVLQLIAIKESIATCFIYVTVRISLFSYTLLDILGGICETDADECDSNPCKNNGTSEDQVNGFVCRCPLQWTGNIGIVDVAIGVLLLCIMYVRLFAV